MWSYLACGFLCSSVSCSRLRLSSIGPCLATPRVTWPTTVSSSSTLVLDNCVLPTLEHSLSVRRAAFWRQDLCRRGTTSLEQSATQSHTASSGGYWRHFYLDSEATAQCKHLTAPNRNILTYFYHFSAAIFVTTGIKISSIRNKKWQFAPSSFY